MNLGKKIIIFYITERSGHHSAALAIKSAITKLDPSSTVTCINAFRSFFPVAERLTHKAYLTVIKRVPRIWEKLYDNPRVIAKSQRIKQWIYRMAIRRLKTILKVTRPDAVICTQAFPCGIMAEYRASSGVKIPLVGVLTDFVPHAYWIYDQVDQYVVPFDGSRDFLAERGVPRSKILTLGIPIDPKYAIALDRKEVLANYGLSADLPVVMVMGGGHGLGPIRKILTLFDSSDVYVQLVVVCGMNRRLYRWISRRRFRKKILFFHYTTDIDRLMSAASVLITKPGGITTAEAMAKRLPMVVLNPIPGQESRNTELLTRFGAAVQASKPQDVLDAVMNILVASKARHGIFSLFHSMNRLAKPHAATDIARLVLKMSS